MRYNNKGQKTTIFFLVMPGNKKGEKYDTKKIKKKIRETNQNTGNCYIMCRDRDKRSGR